MSLKKVLVVDDSASVRQQVAAALSGNGFEVVEAVDGFDGLRRVDEVPALAAIVCDVNMPRMNGLEMVEKLRAEGKADKVPILMLTTEGQDEMKAQGKAAGAKAWIVKPFNPPQLLDVVSKLVLP